MNRFPDRLVVLTFDDGNKSDRTCVGPLLKQYGFGGTFFINVPRNVGDSLTWEDIQWLYESGFEIGNHTGSHSLFRIGPSNRQRFDNEVKIIEEGCEKNCIPRPISFCYCSYRYSKTAMQILQKRGYIFARRGVSPEFKCSDWGDRGPIYNPAKHDQLLIPSTGVSGPKWTFDNLVWAVEQAQDGKIAVLTFHGVPDVLHENISTEPDTFCSYMKYLFENGYKVVSFRDLAKIFAR